MTTRYIFCRACGHSATIRVAGGENSRMLDILSGVARIPLTGFQIGWRMYEWRARGRTVHVEARCPNCPATLRKDGTPDTDAVEVDRA